MKIDWEHILRNKYNYLLTTQVVILIAYPLLHVMEAKFPIVPLLLLIAIIPALWVGLTRRTFLAVISVGVLAFLFNVYYFGSRQSDDKAIMILLLLYAVFYFLAIVILIKRISSGTIVTADTIKGGISVYILLGLFWALLYRILITYDPRALTNIHRETASLEAYYYSFSTLTTLGYGDITPTIMYAKILAIMESIVGPIYLAIFIAQIIGLNIAQKMKNNS